MPNANTVQESFRWRDDDDDEINATWLADTNVNPTLVAADYDTNIRIRYLIQNTGGKDEGDEGYRIYYSIDDASWVGVGPSTSFVRASSSIEFADEDSTTQQIGGGTHDEGYMDSTGQTNSYVLAQDQESEDEFCFQLRSADFTGGEKLEIRVEFAGGQDLDGYTNTPTITSMPTPPEGEIQQSHFRIRNIGGLQTINQDSDWAAAIDVDATLDAQRKDAGCLFGLRFELEEVATVSESKTIIPKCQYRVNAGTWTDCGDEATDDYIDPSSSSATLNVIVVNKASITDGAATTNILSGSSKTFVAGTGEHQAIGASVTLNDQHTEIEWRILIRNRYPVRQESDDADEYEFRVVESDNTILDGTYVIPKITLNLDDGYMGGVGIETQSRVNFIKIPDGTLYAPLEDSVTGQEILMVESLDGGITWSQQDAGASIEQDMECWAMDYDDTNKIIHCVHASADITYYQYATKDHATVPNTWIDGETTVLETAFTAADQSCEIVIRGTVLYAFYPDDSDIWYRKKTDLTSGSFNARVSIDTTGGRTFSGIVAVLGPNSDLIHMFYPDTVLFDLYHRSLNTSDTLGTIHTLDSDIDNGNQARHGMTNPISWYNGTNEKAMVGYLDETDKYLYTVVIQDDGTPDTRQVASNNVACFSDPFPGTLSRQPVASLAVDPATDIAYVFYADDSTHDLWRATHADEGSWASHTEEIDATDIHAIRGQVYTKADSSVVFGYVVDEAYNQDGATPRSGFTGSDGYLEFEISPPTGGVFPLLQEAILGHRLMKGATL